MTTIEYLGKQISELSIKNAQTMSEMDKLSEALNSLSKIYDILNKYLKTEKNILTAIIEGEDAKIIANFFGKKLEEIKE